MDYFDDDDFEETEQDWCIECNRPLTRDDDDDICWLCVRERREAEFMWAEEDDGD